MNISTLFYTFLIWASSSSARILNINSNKSYTAMWAIQLHSSAKDDDAQFIANTLGLTYQKILPDNYYLLTDEHNQDLLDKPNKQITEALKSFSKVIWVEQQVAEYFESRTEFSDPLWNSQNHLKSSPPGFKISQHIEDVWAEGYTGKDVTVVVIDDGVRGTHRELRNRYDNIVSAIIASGSSQTSGHGTQCAGVIAAEANNTLCGVGIAYGCNIAGIKLFAGNSATDADEAQAFYRDHINPSMVDIFSNSWGPSDNGYTFGGPGRLAAEAFKNGIQKGRHSLGSIYVFSCGNGAHVDDSCAFDGYVNSIYTIPVASITKDGKVTGFSERCSAIMTAVYSSDMVSISGQDDSGCVSDFGRTSAAAAFVSGILALALEANRNITWRDMQHLIARSSNWNNVDAAVKRVTNAKKYTVNENFGFGVLDASALINNAKKWKDSVPGQVMCTLNVTAELGTQTIPTKLNINIAKENLNCESKLINSLEHVQLRVDLNYSNRAALAIDVQSMSGTSSRFVYPRKFDAIGNPRTYNNLVVTSVHFWGEPLLGRWTVDIKEGTGIHAIQGTGTLFNMSLVFYGTAEVLKDNDNESGHKNNTPTDPSESNSGAIIGGSIAAVLVLFVIGVCVAYKLKRHSNRSTQNDVPKHDGQELSQNSNTLTSGYAKTVMV